MARPRRVLLLAALVIAAGASAFRETEQNRPLEFEPHVYRGEKLPSLSEQQTRNLQERGNLQK